MRKRALHLTIILFTVIAITGGLVEAAEISLQEALQLALENNTELSVSQLDQEIARQDYETARRGLFPTLNLRSSYTRLSEAPNPMMSPDVYNTKLSMQQPIYMGGKLRTGIEMADKSIKLADWQLEQKKEDILNQVIQSYYGVLMASARVEIEKEALELVRENKRTVKASIEAGVALETDLLQVEIEEGNSQQSLQEARNSLLLAKKSLGLMLNKDLTGMNFIPPEMDIELEPRLEELYQTAQANKPEFKVMTLNQKMTELNLDLEEKSKYPQLMLLGNYSWQDDQFTFNDGSWDLTLSLSLSLFDGGQSRSKQEKIKKQLKKVKNSRENLNQMIQLDLEKRILELQQNKDKIELQKLNLSKAEENLRLAMMRFKAGLATNMEVMNARTMLKQARITLMQAGYQYKLNQFALLYNTGTLADYFEGVTVDEK